MKWQVAVKIAPINDNLKVTLCGANDKIHTSDKESIGIFSY